MLSLSLSYPVYYIYMVTGDVLLILLFVDTEVETGFSTLQLLQSLYELYSRIKESIAY